MQPILGWRVWTLRGDSLLHPIAVIGRPWLVGTNEARCHLPNSRHRAPSPNCACGFNALHRLPQEFRGDHGSAIGAVAAWGEVDVYRTGLRAQFACVLGLLADELSDDDEHQENLRRAAEHYGVPLLGLGELAAHARGYAEPAGELLLPGARRARPTPQRPATPLPTAALASAFAGRGVQINAHLAVDHRRRFMRLGPTPSLAALCGDRIEPAVGRGEIVAEGQPLLRAQAGGGGLVVVPAPAAGTVITVNEDVPDYEQGPAGAGWVVELRLESESIDNSSIAWGRRGAEAYRSYVLASGSDADLLLTCAERPAHPDTLLDPRQGVAWLRGFAQWLDARLRADERLCAALRSIGGGGAVSFEVAGVEALRIAPPAVGSDRWVRTGPLRSGGDRSRVDSDDPAGRPELEIELRPDDLRRYWRGELGLAPDHVSVETADAGPGAPRARNPLHLRRGDRGRLLLANSLHKRLFAAASEILDELGNPWFKAGDAVRDPVRNLEVLAGFRRPDAGAQSA